MASTSNYVFFLGIIFSVAVVSATDFIVGDDKGWTVNFDYSVWAESKDFTVGDRLVFMYPVGVHNVFKVNGTSFQSCTKPPPSEALTSGSDVIVLTSPGKKWYICGVGEHCDIGQKMFINVNPSPFAAVPYGSDPLPFAPFPSVTLPFAPIPSFTIPFAPSPAVPPCTSSSKDN